MLGEFGYFPESESARSIAAALLQVFGEADSKKASSTWFNYRFSFEATAQTLKTIKVSKSVKGFNSIKQSEK